jgi:hypothetical protein
VLAAANVTKPEVLKAMCATGIPVDDDDSPIVGFKGSLEPAALPQRFTYISLVLAG